MEHLEPEELSHTVVEAWGIKNRAHRLKIARMAYLDPTRIRRIHEILHLTLPNRGIPEWMITALPGGGEPLELLLSGEEGVRRVDEYLTELFREAAPAAIFPSAEGASAREDVQINAKLLWERARAQDAMDVQIYDPLREDDAHLDNPSQRIAKALTDLASTNDGRSVRSLLVMAMLDPMKVVRRRAVALGANLIGHKDIYQSIGALREDPDSAVRVLAVTALGRFADRPEIREQLAGFVCDADVKVRRRLIKALAAARQKSARPFESKAFVSMALDPDPEAASIAWATFTRSEVQKLVKGLCDTAAAGKEISGYALAGLAQSRAVSEEIRPSVFRRRLEATRHLGDGGARFVETVGALRFWRDVVPPEIWETLAKASADIGHPAFERAAMMALAKADLMSPWPLILALLSRPVRPGDEALRMEFSERAARFAEGLPNRIQDLLDLVRKKDLALSARSNALWAIGKLPSDRDRGEALESVVFDAAMEGQLIRLALRMATAEQRRSWARKHGGDAAASFDADDIDGLMRRLGEPD